MNGINIALIPKVKSPTSMVEFRPISLCNVLYKLVTKTLVMRLKNILPNVVSKNPRAYVPGILITYNAIIALELFHIMKERSKGRRGTIALKLDISKAYDRVEWGFLRKKLLTMGFNGRWVNFVMDCVSSVSYSFILNKRVCGDVTPSRGLRQGNPLASYLFILVADDFSHMLRKKCKREKFMELRLVEVARQFLTFFLQMSVHSLRELTDRNAALLLKFSTNMRKHSG